jgi:hypothetical protein
LSSIFIKEPHLSKPSDYQRILSKQTDGQVSPFALVQQADKYCFIRDGRWWPGHVSYKWVKLDLNAGGDLRNELIDMFQTFSGSSRRPRQVNLSGQNQNPFAANSWKPTGSGTQQTVANAEKERQQRQQERERLNASKKIQRVWRGHRTRRQIAASRRTAWDELAISHSYSGEESALVHQAQLLLTFFSSKRRDDVVRLISLSSLISGVGFQPFVNKQEMNSQLIRLAYIVLEALQL